MTFKFPISQSYEGIAREREESYRQGRINNFILDIPGARIWSHVTIIPQVFVHPLASSKGLSLRDYNMHNFVHIL